MSREPTHLRVLMSHCDRYFRSCLRNIRIVYLFGYSSESDSSAAALASIALAMSFDASSSSDPSLFPTKW